MAKISIIVPAYNVEQYIEKCVTSILEQTFTDIEVIVVDDGSTDSTGNILEALRDSRLHVFHKCNGGVTSARKLGISKATGDYIGFIDGDDYISDKMYDILYRYALESGADVVFNQAYCSDHDSDITTVRKQLENGIYTTTDGTIEHLWDHIWGKYQERIAGSMCFSLFKKEPMADLYMALPNDITLGEDQVFFAVLTVSVKSIYILFRNRFIITGIETTLPPTPCVRIFCPKHKRNMIMYLPVLRSTDMQKS